DLIRTRLRRQVPQGLRREDDRVEVELTEILRRLLLQGAGHAVGKGRLHRVRARRVRRQVAAAVRGADLEARVAVERSFENEMREGDRGLERVADRVGEQTVAAEPPGSLQLRRALRVDEHEHAELLDSGPEWIERRVAQLATVHAAPQTDAAQAISL